MRDLGLWLVAIAPFAVSIALAWSPQPSPGFLLPLVLGAIAGAILTPLLATIPFVLLYQAWAQGQPARGYLFIPILLGQLLFGSYLGAAAGAWLGAAWCSPASPSALITPAQFLGSAGLTLLGAIALPYLIALPVLGLFSTLFPGARGLDRGFILALLVVANLSSWLSAHLGYRIAAELRW